MTLKTFPNIVINDLDPIIFIGGSYKEIDFYADDSDGVPVDFTGQNALWVLSPYNNLDTVAFSKYATCYNGHVTVFLFNADTISLSGKYIQRLSMTGVPGYEYRLAQGIVDIIPAIREV